MKLEINNKEYEIPFDPMIITLDQMIDWYNMYGKGLEDELRAILDEEKPEELVEIEKKKQKNEEYSEIEYTKILEGWESDRAERLSDQLDDEAISWFSFWSGLDLFDAKEQSGIDELLYHYRLFKQIMIEGEEAAKDASTWTFEWQGETWEIQDWKVNPGTKMSFNEIITPKEAMRQIKKLGEGKFLALKYLSCVFLRKQDEKYEREFIWEDSPRMKLLGTIPVAHAMKVGFFLSICLSILARISQYSQSTEMQPQEI